MHETLREMLLNVALTVSFGPNPMALAISDWPGVPEELAVVRSATFWLKIALALSPDCAPVAVTGYAPAAKLIGIGADSWQAPVESVVQPPSDWPATEKAIDSLALKPVTPSVSEVPGPPDVALRVSVTTLSAYCAEDCSPEALPVAVTLYEPAGRPLGAWNRIKQPPAALVVHDAFKEMPANVSVTTSLAPNPTTEAVLVAPGTPDGGERLRLPRSWFQVAIPKIPEGVPLASTVWPPSGSSTGMVTGVLQAPVPSALQIRGSTSRR